MSRLQLLISVLLFLVLLTTCHARPAIASSLIGTVDNAARDRHESIGVRSSPSRKRDDGHAAAAATRRRPRALPGFHQYLHIGGGWNMYYSSRPAIALPVRK